MTSVALNKVCTERLKEYGLSRQKFVIVVGAGASMPMIPSGSDLQTLVAKACRIRPKLSEPYWKVFERASKKNPEQFCRVIDSAIPMAGGWHGEIYEHIVKLPSLGIITFNYDQYIVKAFGKEYHNHFAKMNPPSNWQKRFSIYSPRNNHNFPSISDFNGTPLLVAIHGYRGPESPSLPSQENYPDWPLKDIILTESQFKDHYFEQRLNLCSWWKNLFASYSVLFLCTTLHEPGVSAALQSLIDEKNPAIQNHQRILLQPAKFETREKRGKKYKIYLDPVRPFEGIEALNFDPGHEYQELVRILAKFSGSPDIGDLYPDFQPIKSHPSYSIT